MDPKQSSLNTVHRQTLRFEVLLEASKSVIKVFVWDIQFQQYPRPDPVLYLFSFFTLFFFYKMEFFMIFAVFRLFLNLYLFIFSGFWWHHKLWLNKLSLFFVIETTIRNHQFSKFKNRISHSIWNIQSFQG